MCERMKLKVNVNKSKVLRFSMGKRHVLTVSKFEWIEPRSSFKFLGVNHMMGKKGNGPK